MSRQKTVFSILGVLVLLGAIGAFMMTGNSAQTNAQSSSKAMPKDQEKATEAPEVENANEASSMVENNSNVASIDVERVLSQRSLGDEDAPVVMREFASLTCGHCADFHMEKFKKLKEEYIDTGKVRFIFTDFPLNAPALDASMVARCLPNERYFKFLSFLFENQEKWAYEANYPNMLRQSAKLVGATDEMLDACLQNQEVRQTLVKRMQEYGEKYGVRSTPSFVFNDEDLISGNVGYEAYANKIETLLEESQNTE